MKCTLILLLINTYNCGWGSPLTSGASNGKPETITTAKLAENLNVLADKCNEKFISSEIKSKSADCIKQPEEKYKHFKCLIFYDINSRLCNSASLNSLVKSEDYNVQINTSLDVNEFCAGAPSWPVFDDKVFPHYPVDLKKIFFNADVCKKLCESQELFSNDVDFYCKYYKWGLDILSKAKVETKQPQSDDVLTNPSQTGLESKSNKMTNILSPRTNVEKPSNIQSTTALSSSTHGATAQQSGISSSNSLTDSATKPNKIGTEESHRIVSSDNANIVTPGNGSKVLETTTVSSATTQAKSNIDIVESEEDPFSGPNLDNDMDPDELSESGTKSSIAFQREPINREIYSNMLQNTYKEDEDDDHFFSLFLTGVIFVILLYVLYHNKNKVSKVVMGLIVEGRAGRRRNSRGHAYRRLDTLEQAVNAPHAVPPAKIIY